MYPLGCFLVSLSLLTTQLWTYCVQAFPLSIWKQHFIYYKSFRKSLQSPTSLNVLVIVNPASGLGLKPTQLPLPLFRRSLWICLARDSFTSPGLPASNWFSFTHDHDGRMRIQESCVPRAPTPYTCHGNGASGSFPMTMPPHFQAWHWNQSPIPLLPPHLYFCSFFIGSFRAKAPHCFPSSIFRDFVFVFCLFTYFQILLSLSTDLGFPSHAAQD